MVDIPALHNFKKEIQYSRTHYNKRSQHMQCRPLPVTLPLSEAETLLKLIEQLDQSVDISHLTPEQVRRVKNFINRLTPQKDEDHA